MNCGGRSANWCHVRANVKAAARHMAAGFTDVSAKGMRISTDEVAEIWTGDESKWTSRDSVHQP